MLMMVRIFLVFSLVIKVQITVQAQITVRGKVIDQTSEQGIGLVTVQLLSYPDSSLVKAQVTDSTGAFELSHIAGGKYLLLFSYTGYQKLYKAITLEAVQKSLDLGSIPLATGARLLNEVVVNGEKAAYQRQAGKLIVAVSGNKLFKAAANAFDILKKVPGLEVNGDGTLQLSGRITPAVLIDGKPAPMSPEELQNYLSTLSPDMIESVEVNANPSAQYDGEFKGVVDIRLKRDKTLGWKGNVSATVQRNAYTLADNNLLLTYKTKKLTYTARLGYTTGTRDYRYQALQHLANTNIMATNTHTPRANNNFNYQLGADYNFKKDQRIEVILRAYQVNQRVRSYNTLYTTDSLAQQVISNKESINNFQPQQDNYGLNMNYTGKVGNSQLQVLGSLLSIQNRQNEDIQNKNIVTSHLLDYWKTILKNDILIRTAQVDLSGNAGKGKLSVGARFAFTTTKNDLHYDTLNTGAVFVTDSGRTNNFQYDEYISAGYITYERKVNKLNITAGLRTEYTHSVANAITLGGITKRDYISWLPAINFTYSIAENRQLNLSISRRITRPGFAQLNPFRFYLSPLNYWIGNPYLQASTTSSLNVSYSRKAFTISVNIGRESDVMTRYPEYDPVTNVLQYLGRNVPYYDFAGVETSFPIVVCTWWRMNHNIGGYYKKEQTPYHGVIYAIPVTSYSFNGSQVFTLPKNVTLDIYYFYRSRGGYAGSLYIAKPVSNIDIGLQKTWMNGKLNCKLNYYDIFNGSKATYIFRQKSIINNELSHWFGMQRVALTVNYSFGRSTYKAKQSNKNDEETRAGM